jgi:hypothetical protein
MKGLRDYKIVSKQAFKKATTPYLSGYGYGWFIDDLYGKKLINHGGNIEGLQAILPCFLMNLCIILLNNITSKKLEKAGNTILAAILGQSYTLPQPQKEITLSTETLKKYVGNYELSDNNVLHILYENGQLYIQNNNDPKIRMLAEKEDAFYLQDDDTEISFIFKKGEKDVIMIRKDFPQKQQKGFKYCNELIFSVNLIYEKAHSQVSFFVMGCISFLLQSCNTRFRVWVGPDGQQKIYNLKYGEHKRQKMDIFLPKDYAVDSPVVLIYMEEPGLWEERNI